jgi:hypothetical protein
MKGKSGNIIYNYRIEPFSHSRLKKAQQTIIILSHTSSTGGPDTILRLWDIKQPSIPKVILIGHTAGIVNIFFQDDAKLYTIDKLKVRR